MKKQLRKGKDPNPNVPAYIINERDWNYFESFAIRGGWREGVRRIGEAWRAYGVRLVLVNLLWACALFSVVGIPPATAMLFFAARRALNREEISYDMTLYSLRRYAPKAWLWSLPSLALGLGMYAILWQVQSGAAPAAAGWAAQALVAVWLGFNLFYWVLWWHTLPEQRAVVENWRRLLAYWRQNPIVCAATVLGSALLAYATIMSGWIFIFLLFLLVPILVALLANAVVGAYPPRE